MPTVAEIREKYPQYADMSDEQLGRALHQKYYSDMAYEDFAQRAGIVAPVAPPVQAPPAPTSALERLRQMSPRQQVAAGGRTALEFAGRTALAPIAAASGLLRGAGTAMIDPLGRRSNASAEVGRGMAAAQGLIPQTLGSQALGELAQQGVAALPQGAQNVVGKAGAALGSPAAQPFIAGAEILGAASALRPRAAPPVQPTQQAVAEITAQGGVVPRSAIMASSDTGTGALVQRAARAGRDLPSGEFATRGIVSKLTAQNRRAVLRHAGIGADKATPEVLTAARERIGDVFENIYDPSVTVPKAPVDAVLNNVAQNMPIAQGSREAVEAAATRISESFANGGGTITGRSAKELRAWLMARRETAFKGQAIDAADAFDDLIEGLDDAVFTVSPPGARQAIGNARLQWRNFKAIEHATDRGLSGDISTRKLASYLSHNKYTKRAYAANEPGSLEALVRALDTFQDKFPNSGTASRAASVAEPVAAVASGGASLPASFANMAVQRYLAGPAGPLAPSLTGPSPTFLGLTGLLGNLPYEEEQ